MGINATLIRVSLCIALDAYFIVLLKKKESILQIRTSKQYLNCIIIEYCPFLHFAHKLTRDLSSSAAADSNLFNSLPEGLCLRVFVEAGENETGTDMLQSHKCLQFDGQNYSIW